MNSTVYIHRVRVLSLPHLLAHFHHDLSVMNAARDSQQKTIARGTGATFTDPIVLPNSSKVCLPAFRVWKSQQTWFQYFWRNKSVTVHTPPASGKGRWDLVDLIIWFSIVEMFITKIYPSDRGRVKCRIMDESRMGELSGRACRTMDESRTGVMIW